MSDTELEEFFPDHIDSDFLDGVRGDEVNGLGTTEGTASGTFVIDGNGGLT